MKKNLFPAGIVMLTLIAKNTSNFLSDGKHVVSIKSVSPATAKQSAEWKDQTMQLKVTFEDKAGKQFSAWYNLNGFRRFKDLTPKDQQSGKFLSMGDEGYAVTKSTGKRVVDDTATESAQNIICKLASDSGIAEGESFSEADLVGRTVGIVIADNDRGNARVKNTFVPTEAQVAESQEA